MRRRVVLPSRRVKHGGLGGVTWLLAVAAIVGTAARQPTVAADGRRGTPDPDLDQQLIPILAQHGFTGRIGQTLEARLGRPVDQRLAGVGRLLFFDPILSLHGDNSCAGCHVPAWGFGDSQSIAIGVNNHGIAGPDRFGPRNQRRAPSVLNSALFRRQMLTGRFESLSLDGLDNSMGFRFPPPEGTAKFPPGDPLVRTLLAAQSHIPTTDLVEMAGFTGTAGTIGPEYDQFDDGLGDPVPAPDQSGYRNEPIRAAVAARVNSVPLYREYFSRILGGPLPPAGIDYPMIARALAEFQISLTFADAPIDRYARGFRSAMTQSQKRGALLFFGRAGCVACHAVSGTSNEMFSDFENHVTGVPQIATVFGAASGNVKFDGPGADEDFGAEKTSHDPADRYAFRTSPLRNVGVQPAFFHNGAFTQLEDAIHYHLDVIASAPGYDPEMAGLKHDLTLRRGPIPPVLAKLDPRLLTPITLTPAEFTDLVEFVRHGLLDHRAVPDSLCTILPLAVPSGMDMGVFQDCRIF
jgi:cytochrome c peroxidase